VSLYHIAVFVWYRFSIYQYQNFTLLYTKFGAENIVYNVVCCVWPSTDDDSGMRRSQLVNWYLEDIENEIDSEAELVERKTIVEKVIYRLIHHVCLAVISFCTNHW